MLDRCPCHCEAATGGATGEKLVTMAELRASELRETQADDKVKMQVTMHLHKIETRVQKLGAFIVYTGSTSWSI